MVSPIERRAAIDDCGCRRCRDVDASHARRTTAGDVRWTLRLFRRQPWLVAVVCGAALLWTAAEPVIAAVAPSVGPDGWVTNAVHGTLHVLLLALFLRAVVGAAVADDVTAGEASPGRAVRYAIRRFVPLALTFAALTGLLVLVHGASVLVVSVLVFDFGLLSQSVFDGLTATLLFGALVAPVFYKLWLAPDVCVVGGEAPLAALRGSWRITSAHWRRTCLLLASFAVTLAVPHALGDLFALVGGRPAAIPGLDVLAVQFQWLTAAAWYGVGATVYVRAVL